jgi:hypothetical protein
VVRNPNIGSILYSPNDAPTDPAQLQRFLREELAKISAAITALAVGHLDKTNVAPSKPRDGDIRYADGTNWNPGGTGRGLYMHNGTAWVLVKAI